MISVVIPLYNKEKQIYDTLQSVLNQSFQSFEILIINDGSTDHSVAEVEKIKDARIRLMHQQNAGVSAARNKGIKEAKYGLIAFLDADDEWKSNYLDTQYKLHKKYPECGIYACNYESRDNEKKISATIIQKLPFKETDGVMYNYFEVACCSHPPLWTSAILVRKEVIAQVGGFPVGIKSGEDLITWAKLATLTLIAYCRTPLAIYYMGEGYILSNTPPRPQDQGDPVGAELKKLLANTSGEDYNDLKKYISLWHKMRASTHIRYNYKREAIKECFLSLRYNPRNYKVYFFIVMSLLPRVLKKYVISHFT